MEILLSAFKGEHNSSYQLIKDINCDKLFLTNSFEGLEKDIEKCECEQYSAVIMFGLDTKLNDKIRIDARAQSEFGTRDTVFFIQAAGLAYYHRTKCGVYHQGRPVALVSHHAPACISLRLDDIQRFALMIYRNKLRMIYTASP